MNLSIAHLTFNEQVFYLNVGAGTPVVLYSMDSSCKNVPDVLSNSIK